MLAWPTGASVTGNFALNDERWPNIWRKYSAIIVFKYPSNHISKLPYLTVHKFLFFSSCKKQNTLLLSRAKRIKTNLPGCLGQANLLVSTLYKDPASSLVCLPCIAGLRSLCLFPISMQRQVVSRTNDTFLRLLFQGPWWEMPGCPRRLEVRTVFWVMLRQVCRVIAKSLARSVEPWPAEEVWPGLSLTVVGDICKSKPVRAPGQGSALRPSVSVICLRHCPSGTNPCTPCSVHTRDRTLGWGWWVDLLSYL